MAEALTHEQLFILRPNLPIVRWLISHLNEVPGIVAAVRAFVEASSTGDIDGMFAAFNQLLAIARRIFDDFPDLSQAVAQSIEAMDAEILTAKAQLEAQGIDWQRLIALLPELIRLFTLIRDIFKNPAITTGA